MCTHHNDIRTFFFKMAANAIVVLFKINVMKIQGVQEK